MRKKKKIYKYNKSDFITNPIGKHKHHYLYFHKPCLYTTSVMKKYKYNFENPNINLQMKHHSKKRNKKPNEKRANNAQKEMTSSSRAKKK